MEWTFVSRSPTCPSLFHPIMANGRLLAALLLLLAQRLVLRLRRLREQLLLAEAIDQQDVLGECLHVSVDDYSALWEIAGEENGDSRVEKLRKCSSVDNTR